MVIFHGYVNVYQRVLGMIMESCLNIFNGPKAPWLAIPMVVDCNGIWYPCKISNSDFLSEKDKSTARDVEDSSMNGLGIST